MTDTPTAKDRGGDRSVAGSVAGYASARRGTVTCVRTYRFAAVGFATRAFRNRSALLIRQLPHCLTSHVFCYWILHVTLLEKSLLAH